MVLSKIDQYGKIGWLTVSVIAFWLAWPIGLLVIAFLLGSGRAQRWRAELRMPGTWSNLGTGGMPWRTWNGFRSASSGNQAFDDYRSKTLSELEEEQREFQSFLEQLRAARDKAEFDAFMAQRRNRPAETSTSVDANV